ncbi:hypothetical protein [Roseobacter sp. MH60115]|uniref:hypothetical protein n=1 Tax=Roseobacter sp. MH60115 TaxID=2785324 RepID=UPI0018A2B943|nr:hypothetical protein [Roseobacter sp. MH60115]
MALTVSFDVPVRSSGIRWSRNRISYRVTPNFAGNPRSEGDSQEECDGLPSKTLSDWSGYLVEMPTPIIMAKGSFNPIISPSFRIYEPFEINQKARNAGAMSDIHIPADQDGRISVPGYAINGMTASNAGDDCLSCLGLRIDFLDGNPENDIHELIRLFRSAVREVTFQWWLSSRTNPFDLGHRLSFELTPSFGAAKPYPSSNSDSYTGTWRGSTSLTNRLGFERPVGKNEWAEIDSRIRAGREMESATSFFMDAVSAFMAHEDHNCLVNACVALEIMECKMRALSGKKINGYGDKLRRDAVLWRKKDEETIKKMFIDRGHIAHGRPPYNYRKNPVIMVDYLELLVEYYNRFLDRSGIHGWPAVTGVNF